MAMNPLYQNKLAGLINDPKSFTMDPSYQFGLDAALQGTQRGMANMRGSGNVLAALAQTGAGYAGQQYGAQVDRLGKLAGQEQQFQLGTDQNTNTATRNANDLSLGLGQNANTATHNANDFTLGTQQNTNTANKNNQDFGLGMYSAGNQFALGQQQNQNNANKNWWDYSLGGQQNNINAANNQNRYNVDWLNAQTNRGQAQSNDWWKNPANQQLPPR